MNWIFNKLKRINGLSTPFGGISWSSTTTEDNNIPIFRKSIHLTYTDNQEIISFLKVNVNKIIFLNTFIDASIWTREQIDFIKTEQIDIDSITSCEFSGVPFPLPNDNNELITITFYFRNDHILQYSSGGTGVIRVGINGFFELGQTIHGSPTIAYHLKELEASLESKVTMLNKE